MQVISDTPQETLELGRQLGSLLQPGDLITITGDLGAGKTLLAKGIAAAQGVAAQQVTSPTFTIAHEYSGRIPIYHLDLYRITRPEELEDLDYRQYFDGDRICLVEWPEVARSLLPPDFLEIVIEKGQGDCRFFSLQPHGPRSEAILEELVQEVKP